MPDINRVNAIKDRVQGIQPDMEIIHYMADLYSINQANPHAAENHTSGPTPTTHILKNPDSLARVGLNKEGKLKSNRSK